VLNLAQIGAGALPIGGVAAVRVEAGLDLSLSVRATGARVRLRPEVIDGLNGAPLRDGLSGHWVQAYFLHGLVAAAGGTMLVHLGEGEMVVAVRLPL
jgi:histidine phosphotransferase ChpT